MYGTQYLTIHNLLTWTKSVLHHYRTSKHRITKWIVWKSTLKTHWYKTDQVSCSGKSTLTYNIPNGRCLTHTPYKKVFIIILCFRWLILKVAYLAIHFHFLSYNWEIPKKLTLNQLIHTWKSLNHETFYWVKLLNGRVAIFRFFVWT